MTAAAELPLLYLGPDLPRWSPRSVVDVDRAIREGDLRERHWTDVKSAVTFTDGDKKELARDLGSFANDGGALLYGVAEDKAAGTLTVEPVELAGLAERIDQIARARLDPPLFVACHPLRSDNDPTRGVMLVEVPASPFAPHMAAGVYYGRGDTTRTRLTDAEIARLHVARTTRQSTGEQMVRRARRLDRWQNGAHAHAIVVVSPQASPPDLLTDMLERTGEVSNRVISAWRTVPRADAIGETYGALQTGVATPHGVMLRSYGYDPGTGSAGSDPEQHALAIEVHDDGAVTLFGGGVSKPNNKGDETVMAERVLVWAESVIATAVQIATSRGYGGAWTVAVGVTNLAGMREYQVAMRSDGMLWPRDDGEHVETTTASTAEMMQRPQEVVRRVTRRFLRGLGGTDVYGSYFHRPDGTPGAVEPAN